MAELQLRVEHLLPWSGFGRTVSAAVAIAVLPIVASSPVTVVQGSFDAESAGWIALFSLVSFGTLLLTRYEWIVLQSLNVDIDDFLHTDHNRAKAVRFVSAYGARRPQLGAFGVGALLAAGSLAILDVRDLLPTLVSATSYAVVALTGALLVSDLYGGVFAALMIRLMSTLDDIRIQRIIPAATPALRGLTFIFVTSAIGATLLFALISIPLSYVVWSSDFNRDVLVILGAIYVTGLTFFAFGVGLPQYWLSRMVDRERNNTIVELQSDIWQLSRSTGSDDPQRTSALVEVLDRTMASPASTVSRLVRFGSAVAVAAVPLLIAELVRNIST